MALMPELSPRDDERTVLNRCDNRRQRRARSSNLMHAACSWRYGFTILSNVAVFGIFFSLVNFVVRVRHEQAGVCVRARAREY